MEEIMNTNEEIKSMVGATPLELAEKIKNANVEIKMEHGQDNRLYGSVTAKDIAEELKRRIGVDVDKRKIQLKDSIRAYGKHDVQLKVHTEITAKFVVYVHD